MQVPSHEPSPPYVRQVSSLAYETDFNMILDIFIIPIFVDFLKSLRAENEGEVVSKDA